MMLSHYFDIRPEKPGICYELYGRALMAVHLTIAEGETLAVDWPQWEDSPGRFGFVMRLFGIPEALFKVLFKMGPLVSHRLVQCSGLLAVPADATPRWAYQRERAACRRAPSRWAREQRRMLARGVTPPAAPHPQARKETHWLPMQSHSNQQSFAFAIRRVPASEAQNGTLNTYGLGIPVPHIEVTS